MKRCQAHLTWHRCLLHVQQDMRVDTQGNADVRVPNISLTTSEDELAGLEWAIAEQVHHHAPLQVAEQQFCTVPGVGPRVALPLLVAYARYRAPAGEQGTAKGVVAYGGLDPQSDEGGASIRRRALISRQGGRLQRARLHMGALGAYHGANPSHTFYQWLVDRGKPKKLALIAVARRADELLLGTSASVGQMSRQG
jgi:hypothetical protein